MQKRYSGKQVIGSGKNGFTFVDLAVLVVVISFFAVALITTKKTNTGLGKESLTLEKLENIKSTLNGYAKTHGYYPCPANPKLKMSDGGSGVSAIDSSTGRCDVSVLEFYKPNPPDDPITVLGAVPVNTLGMMPDDMLDGWGNKILYSVTYTLTNSDDYGTSSGDIIVLRDYSSGNPQGGSVENHITDTSAYVLISFGHDGVGAYPAYPQTGTINDKIKPMGVSGVKYSDSKYQLQNHHMVDSSQYHVNKDEPDNVFVKPGSPGVFTGKQFDDLVIWSEKEPAVCDDYFVRAYGRSNNDLYNKVIEDLDGNYIVVGSSGGIGIITKFDTKGNKIWEKYAVNTGSVLYNLKQISNGNYITVGQVYTGSTNGYDAMVTEFDKDGNIIWGKTIGGAKEDNFDDVIEASDNGIVAVGFTISADLSGSGDRNDGFAVKFNKDHTTIDWQLRIGNNTLWDRIQGVTEVNNVNKDLVLVGKTHDFENKTSGVCDYTNCENRGGGDALIVGLTANGTKSWAKVYGDKWLDRLYGVTETVYNEGYANTLVTTGYYNGDIIIHKFDGTGNTLWAKKAGIFGSGNTDSSFDIYESSDNGFLIAGYSKINPNQEEALLFKVDKDSTSGTPLIFKKILTGSVFDGFYGIAETKAKNDILAVGYTESYGVGQKDGLLAKLNASAALGTSTCSYLGDGSQTISDITADVNNSSANVTAGLGVTSTSSIPGFIVGSISTPSGDIGSTLVKTDICDGDSCVK